MPAQSCHSNKRSQGGRSLYLKRMNKVAIDTSPKHEAIVCKLDSRDKPKILPSYESPSPSRAKRTKKWGCGRYNAPKASLPEIRHGRKGARGYHTPDIDEAVEINEEEKTKYVALDCEMVSVGGESTLARVSIVNWYGRTLLNTFVQVEEVVTDYLTFVSGIRQADIESEDAMTFDDCRMTVLEIFSGKVVIGHALKNDFRALNITHPWYLTRDTAKFEPFMKPSREDESILLPRKLKALAELKLGMHIQLCGQEHDSIEDATAAMELYKKARRKWENAVEWKRRKTNAITRLKMQQQ